MIIVEKYINLLVQMLAIPSVSRKEDIRADFLQTWLKNEGLTVKRKKNNLIITKGTNPADATILLNSHIDTVSPGEGWKSDPYLPSIKKGKITGLGSNDAGASVVSLIAAFQEIEANEQSDKVVLVISAEEEVSGMNGISSVIEQLPNLKFAIVGEPTGMQAGVAERGLMVVDAIAQGTPGHAARSEGVNAIYKAIGDIEKIREIHFSDHSVWLKDPSVNVTMINAGTGHNVVPGKCVFVIDVRSNDKYSNERLFEILSKNCTSKLTPRSMRLKSSCLSDSHPVCALLKNLGMKAFGSPTLSDMALLKIDSIKIGPGDSARSHTANEYILAQEISDAIEGYSKLISELLKIEL
jgi:acetylornithine deacetylase